MTYLPETFNYKKVSFKANGTNAQVVGTGDTIIICNDEQWDEGASYNNGTGVFTPTEPGYYQVDAGVGFIGSDTGFPIINLNGSRYKIGGIKGDNTFRISCIVPFNGTTDNASFAVNLSSGATIDVSNFLTFFSAHWVQPL